MSDNNEIDMMEDAEFEMQITAMGDDQPALLKFVARQQFSVGKIVVSHGRRIRTLEKRNKKVMGIIGGSGAILATAVVAAIDFFLHRSS